MFAANLQTFAAKIGSGAEQEGSRAEVCCKFAGICSKDFSAAANQMQRFRDDLCAAYANIVQRSTDSLACARPVSNYLVVSTYKTLALRERREINKRGCRRGTFSKRRTAP